MAKESKGFILTFTTKLRRLFGRPLRAQFRTGKIISELHDAARLQKEQRQYLQQIGNICIELHKQGQFQHARVQKLIEKLEENRQKQFENEKKLELYQNRGSIRSALHLDNENEDALNSTRIDLE